MTDRAGDLEALQRVVPGATRVGSPGANPRIGGLAYDSRQAGPGDLFLCVRGLKSDGIRFLPDAAARGAVAAVIESDAADLPVPALRVPSVRDAMPAIASAFYGHPSRKLSLIGVTGTNGKTTTTYLIEAIARAAGLSTGVIGTIGARINDEVLPGDRTTPESPDLQALLARMAEAATAAGMAVAMEVSSHALDLKRTAGCEFDAAVFTNLTQDHLDYHGTLEDYFAAKARLFTEYPRASSKDFTGVLNVDDPYGRLLAEVCEGQVMTCAVERDADLRARQIEASPRGISFRLDTAEDTFPVRLRIGGLFNVYNSLGAMGAARSLGIAWETILPALEAAPGVPGRFESVDVGQDFSVIVDYAHSPDGLENVLRAGRALDPRRIITVFGCGGDRDRTKRPIMGRIAAELPDRVVVTSDNPRTEEPGAIINEILAGIPAGSVALENVVDRREAIRRAVSAAEPGDLVVIAGKGHEDYQIFADRTVHFDDREEARGALSMLDYPLDLLGRVMEATPLGPESALRAGTVRRISTDSRTVERGDLFFAIQGENIDGHRFIADALRKGAAGAVADRERVPEDTLSAGAVLAVADPLLALGSLAAWHRNRFPVRVVAITGSVGKTTTKDLIAAVLSQRYRTLKSPGNLNTEIGLPLTLFELGPNDEVLVVEMAMRGAGQIRYLARIARPDVAVITNIGLSHMELLGSQDAISEAKAELLDFLPRGGAAVLNADDRYYDFLRSRVPPETTTVPFGLDTPDGAAVTGRYLGPTVGPGADAGSRLGASCVLGARDEAATHPLTLPLLGRHNLRNALAATSVGLTLGVEWPGIIQGLEAADVSAMRMAVHELPEGGLLIDDAYNASSPETMLAALDVLGELPHERKTAVLGSMLELGAASDDAHRRVGEAVAAGGIDRLVTVGEGGSRMADAALGAGMPPVRVFRCDSNQEALEQIQGTRHPFEAILVKGSRGVAMEQIVAGLREAA